MSEAFHVDIPTAEDMHALGRALGQAARPGDLILLHGPLGAGKTTLTQGIGAGMGISERISSPTYVIAMVHPSPRGIPLVHVDAYRLASLDELDALDLDASLEEAVTVVEWGEGKAEVLSADRLEIRLERAQGADARASMDDLYEDAPRIAHLVPVGERGRALAEAAWEAQ